MAIALNNKCYLINQLLPMIINGQNFVFLFRQGAEQPHQGDMNTSVAIPNTSKEVPYQIRVDLEVATVFFWTCRRLRWAIILS